MINNSLIVEKVKNTLIRASSSMSAEHFKVLEKATKSETDENAKGSMELMQENAIVANKCASPLCDDTGIPH